MPLHLSVKYLCNRSFGAFVDATIAHGAVALVRDALRCTYKVFAWAKGDTYTTIGAILADSDRTVRQLFCCFQKYALEEAQPAGQGVEPALFNFAPLDISTDKRHLAL